MKMKVFALFAVLAVQITFRRAVWARQAGCVLLVVLFATGCAHRGGEQPTVRPTSPESMTATSKRLSSEPGLRGHLGHPALVNPKDEHHLRARKGFESLSSRKAELLTSSYVPVETYAMPARGMGLRVIQASRSDLVPLYEVVWVEGAGHEVGLDLLIERRKRGLSLVDTTSFVVMRTQRLDEAFCFDPSFANMLVP